MSTTTIYAQGPRAIVLTDTAGVDGEGVVRSWVSKVITLPHLKTAITTRGAVAALPALACDLAGEFSSFDDMAAHGAAFLQDAHDHHMMRWADQTGGFGEFELAITGWSLLRKRCEAYAISSIDHPGAPAFTFVRNDILLAPVPPTEALTAAGLLVNGVVPASLDRQTMLLRMIELQRRLKVPIGGVPGAPEAHIVGGKCVATEITEAGIAQRVIHVWPDELDEPIRPAPLAVELRGSAPGPVAAAGMSRQQRRAAVAQARKAAHAA